MKRNMKKIFGLFLLLILVFTLSGCAEQQSVPNEEVYQKKSDQYVEMLSSMSAEELEAQVSNLEENLEDFEQEVALYPYIYGQGAKFDFTAEAYVSLLKSFEANLDDLGAYVQVKEYEGGTEKDDGVSYSVVYEFEKHDMRLTLDYDKNNVVTTVTADPIYTTGEILEKAALNTVLGMGVVFAVLILICLIISCFGFIPAIEAKFSKKKKEEKPVASPAVAAAPASVPVVEEESDDLALIAVITAAVAATLGTSTDGFVVRSIKRKSNNKWKR